MNDGRIKEILNTPENLSRALRQLPVRVPPPRLSTALRVIASKEQARRSLTFSQRVRDGFERLQLVMNNMMRPFAIPAAGGLFSAVALFSTWVVPTYPLRAHASYDIPTMLTTEGAVRGTVPLSVNSAAIRSAVMVGINSDGEAVVDVTVDEQGRMVDYKVVAGTAVLASAVNRRRLENALLFTEFVPATAFGKPMTVSVVRVSVGFNSRVAS